jgi:hypothetical protein
MAFAVGLPPPWPAPVDPEQLTESRQAAAPATTASGAAYLPRLMVS